MRKLISIIFGFAFTLSLTNSAFAVYYSTYNNQAFCTQDVYVCPNGTTVGRTGYNCQFVCPSPSAIIPVNNSYSYTNGCYTYYYNGNTNKTTLLSYNCSNNYNYTNNYNQGYSYTYTYPTTNSTYYTVPATYYYTQPTTYTYPYYYQYQPTYSNYNYSGYGYTSYPSGYTDTGYNNYNYGNYYDTNYGYNYGSTYNQSSCYYLAGIQVCY
jgi:hypothetical protein